MVFCLIAKVERKEKALYLKHEVILHRKEKKKKQRRKVKTIVPPFMFLFNSFEVYHPLCKENKNMQFSPLNQ